MGYNNREVEKKFLVEGFTLEEASKVLESALGKWSVEVIKAIDTDYFWKSPVPEKADFIRIRTKGSGGAQMTLKHTDTGSTLDRVEVDVALPGPNSALSFWRHLLGNEQATLSKVYHVYAFDEEDNEAVSVYSVLSDRDKVYLEIECKSLARVEYFEGLLRKSLPLHRETRSLYEIYVKNK